MTSAPEIRPAATVLLVRDGPEGIEVFMVKRHHQIEFATGALVFPGGKVDPEDADEQALAAWPGRRAVDDAGAALRVAAIRETFEECGVLLARERGATELLAGARLAHVRAEHRTAVHAGERTFGAVLAAEGLELAADLLVHLAHWVTPDLMPKRFDTHFFLVRWPSGQAAVHDGLESVDSLWTTPGRALAERDAGRAAIMFPTLRNLERLARSATVDEAIADARATPVVRIEPWVADGPDGPELRIPDGAGYERVAAPLSDVMRGGG